MAGIAQGFVDFADIEGQGLWWFLKTAASVCESHELEKSTEAAKSHVEEIP